MGSFLQLATPMDDVRAAAISRVRIDDVAFDRVTMRQTVSRIVEMARSRDRARCVCTGNLDHLVLIAKDEEFRSAYEGADLVVADGAPIVWLSKLAASEDDAVLPERVAGSDLFWELAKASSETGIRLFFLGGMPGAASKAAAIVEKRFPGATICGTYCPPFEMFHTEQEQRRIRDIVRAANPDVLLVAFGAPKQEKWIAANKDRLGVPVAIGVGGSFEMASGMLRRAPRWIQDLGLEWLYRFAQQPRRLFQRYFIDDLPYLLRAGFRTALARVRRPPRLPA
jgi:N-acetylglucosaminyldiphosphoundecaprenol N-acetyl-beta-D-mannosaminyltransferase